MLKSRYLMYRQLLLITLATIVLTGNIAIDTGGKGSVAAQVLATPVTAPAPSAPTVTLQVIPLDGSTSVISRITASSNTDNAYADLYSEFQKGMDYASWWQGQYSTTSADQSLANLKVTGTKWLGLVATCYKETYASTGITCALERTPTDDDLVHAVTYAHSLGMKVMLKPHLDLNNDPSHWRGEIGAGFTSETQWQTWFASYRTFINHYADLAQAIQVEQLAVGTELVGTSGRETDWRVVIGDVRNRFSGSITYASNHSGEETSIHWWDAVDYIGIDAYYPLTNKNNPSLAELRAAWANPALILENLSKQYNRPVIFTEIGYRSIDGANQRPWEWQSGGILDLQEQADCYHAVLETFWNKAWFRGIYWWYWSTNPNQGGVTDKDYTPFNKPAETIMKGYYLALLYLPSLLKSQ